MALSFPSRRTFPPLVARMSVLCLLAFAVPVPAQSSRELDLIAQVDQADLLRETSLLGYTVEEHYTITNSHFHSPATAHVKVTYTRAGGKTYQVISRAGPSILASHVLNSMLAEEERLSRNPARASSQLTSANYTMTHTGAEVIDGRLCEVLAITPLHRSPHVLIGRIWVDATTKRMVRITGAPPKSPSFFAGKPEITRDYADVDGFSLATHSHATSSGFFGGSSVVDIGYVNYQITQ